MPESKQEGEIKKRRLFDKRSNYVKDGATVLGLGLFTIAFGYWWFFEFLDWSVSDFMSTFLGNTLIFIFIILPLWAIFGKKS